MNEIKRFGMASVMALAVALGMFVLMGQLLSQPHSLPNGQSAQVNFDFVKNFTPPVVKEPKKKPLPEPKEAKQPPAAPALSLSNNSDDTDVYLPQGVKTNKDWKSIDKIPLGPIGTGGSGGSIGKGGTLKMGIAPMYPPALLQRKVEGWVDVLITINEMGGVSDIEVLANKPNRAFDKAAIKAVRKWTFHPKIVDGKAVPFQVRQKIEFNIDE